MEGDAANHWSAYDQVFGDPNLTSRRHARPRQWWLILFSLGRNDCVAHEQTLIKNSQSAFFIPADVLEASLHLGSRFDECLDDFESFTALASEPLTRDGTVSP